MLETFVVCSEPQSRNTIVSRMFSRTLSKQKFVKKILGYMYLVYFFLYPCSSYELHLKGKVVIMLVILYWSIVVVDFPD